MDKVITNNKLDKFAGKITRFVISTTFEISKLKATSNANNYQSLFHVELA